MASISHPATPSIFVSSTVEEFRDLRSAIAFFLRSQGLSVRLSEAEDFQIRGDRSAMEECFENVRSSDYYVLIIGGTRGSHYQEGVSITRQEYRVAREHYLAAGKPRLFLYLRGSTEQALRGGETAQEIAEIDDSGHLNSFINEVENPPVASAPSYLFRFRDAEHLITSLASHLNLGRNLTETLTRHSLVSELTSNLTNMLERSRHNAYPHHLPMWRERKEIQLTVKQLGQRIRLSSNQGVHLALALTGRIYGSNLRTKVIEEAFNAGIFLEFNAVDGTFQESVVHQGLRQTLEDINRLCQVDNPRSSSEWDMQLLQAIRNVNINRLEYFEVSGEDLATAFGYYGRVEDVFNDHVALCRFLLGRDEEFKLPQRQPLTPLGEREEQKIQAERVSAAEVEQLIRNDVWPLGTNPSADIFGKTHEQQIETLIEPIRKVILQTGIESIEDEILRNIAESILDKNMASQEAGIEDLSPPRD